MGTSGAWEAHAPKPNAVSAIAIIRIDASRAVCCARLSTPPFFRQDSAKRNRNKAAPPEGATSLD
jgi:hypothetical protein